MGHSSARRLHRKKEKNLHISAAEYERRYEKMRILQEKFK
jgi:hypothetical protein